VLQELMILDIFLLLASLDSNIYPIPGDSSSATGQVGISTGVAIPSALPSSGVSEQPLPCLPELHEPSYISGIGDLCPALLVAKEAELSAFSQDMKGFDAIKAATLYTLAIGQTQDAVALLKVPDHTSTAEVNPIVENTPLQTFIQPSIPNTLSATREETISCAGSLAPVENLVRSSLPDASPVGLEPKECISEQAPTAGAPLEENQQRTPPPRPENR